jgi:hypothetical protein
VTDNDQSKQELYLKYIFERVTWDMEKGHAPDLVDREDLNRVHKIAVRLRGFVREYLNRNSGCEGSLISPCTCLPCRSREVLEYDAREM